MTDSRERMLDAAWRIVAESFGFATVGGDGDTDVAAGPAKILGQIKAADVARRAGLTTGAFYNRWPNRASFLRDFLDYALSVERSSTFDRLIERYGEVVDLPLDRRIIELARSNVDAVAENPSFAIQTHLWSLMRSRTDIGRRMAGMYEGFRGPMQAIYEGFLDELGRELRPPFTMHLLSSLIMAASEGLTMQAVADGADAPDPDGFGWMLLALLPVVTREPGDERDVFAVIAELIER